MKTLSDFKLHLQTKGKELEWLELAEDFLPDYLDGFVVSADKLSYARGFADKYIAGTANAVKKIVLLFWYHDLNSDKAISTYMVTLLGTLDVLENQRIRMEKYHGKEKAAQIFEQLGFPTLGRDLAQYPSSIVTYLNSLRSSFSLDECKNILAGNHHGIDVSGFAKEKEFFRAAPDLQSYLQGKHARLVQNLQEHCDSGKLWFEQHITQDVVDYVKSDQEIQTGVLHGNRLIVEKIPYNPAAWLFETDPLTKRYYACHCPFVRASILDGTQVDSLWCYCSGGFTKLLMDYLFGQELGVELLESALDGSDVCRFAIILPS
ncbi:MAG TPA: DUF6144 family protein [Candidatus Cloacimonas sp.]|nr:DUF6144 family protein [Candidatus Cloacimonas sp.]